ncbi:esterase-like activity of phytase family protein [Aquimarina sp. ERC-38]|uniref:esterase-like activity of phytase family protein n=1 Tax=Aquimarina sp. ERC-38 TaxID=2949996 RepID=UPI002246B7E0|nr:esterase-like activity of phytase family protein [Aquimarina sp. ERC-38]UZO79650.1 esterase-like activity of phytase family protein [Aquimarina sp. ERC-38]
MKYVTRLTLKVLGKTWLRAAKISMLSSIPMMAQTHQIEEANTTKFQLKQDQNFSQNYFSKSLGKSFFNFGDILVSRAVLPANTFATGPTSGRYLGTDTINKQPVPFIDKQPVQGFSSVLNNFDGTFIALSDNGFGSMENSAGYNLRLYTIKPNFKSVINKNQGDIEVLNFIELKDPNNLIPFAITNEFSAERILTGADFDIESIQQTANGDYWIGDEFGPFLLQFDRNGILLSAPIPLPNVSEEGGELRSPQNPFNEESSALRIMNAMRSHAAQFGSKPPVMSPWFVMLDDNNEATFVADRKNPTEELTEASSAIFNISSLNRGGHDVVVYTVNDSVNMNLLMNLGVQGIISDSPDVLLAAVRNFDGDQDGKADFLTSEGLIDITKFDAQGHRGARNLRPENTLPSMEAALDNLMPTLETDCGITRDSIPVLDHDPHIEAAKVRRIDSMPYVYEDEVLVKDLTLAEIQNTFIADRLLDGRPLQSNDLDLSPVSVAFTERFGLPHPYVMPSLQQLFDFVRSYVRYYKYGEGKSHPEASLRWKNAAQVRYNIETKINPRTDTDDRGDVFAERTLSPEVFTQKIVETIIANKLEDRADIQSFDFRTLLLAHQNYPSIRTVCLFGDFPKVGTSGDGTNLQDQNGENTPWLAGMYWPYRSTQLNHPFLVKRSGGFEGMAIDIKGEKLYPLLEKPLENAENKNLLIHEFDIRSKAYSQNIFEYPLNEKATAIGDFVLFSDNRGVIIERDDSQGDLNGFKAVYEVQFNKGEKEVAKQLNLDLLNMNDFAKLSVPGLPGDVGIGREFAFPFVTIESVVVFNPFLVGIVNDNNYPFSVGRHVGTSLPDDNEFILVWLDQPLGTTWKKNAKELYQIIDKNLKVYPNTFTDKVSFELSAQEPTKANITIYNINGQLVKTLEETVDSFGHTVHWNLAQANTQQIPSGVYIAVIEMNGAFYKRKLIKE